MHWLLLRLLRAAEDVIPAKEIRSVLNAHFRPMALAAEVEFVTSRDGLSERPYGWAWALALAHEAASLDDPDGKKWSSALQPLADAVTGCFLDWLPKATYPIRYGVHTNSAFGMGRALDYADAQARTGNRALLEAITEAASRVDVLPAGPVPPNPSDLIESPRMASLIRQATERYDLIVIDAPPAAVVSDAADGQIAHLHGLNASRAWCWRRIAESLPAGDPRIGPAVAAARTHAGAALPHVVGDDYMVEHWLACYAVLMLS